MNRVLTESPTYAEGKLVDPRCDAAGRLIVTNGTLSVAEDETNLLIRTSGGKVRQLVVATGLLVGGDATMTATIATVPTGPKTFTGKVAGTGAVTQTQTIYGGFFTPITTTNGYPIGVITLSGTTEKHGFLEVVTAAFPYIAVLTSGTTGTGATGEVRVGF